MEIDGEQFLERFGDVRWRLRNLYKILPAEARDGMIPFVPRPEQEMVFDHIIENPRVPLTIIKSRQLGFSTGLSVIMADFSLSAAGAGTTCSLVDQTQPDAHKKMREKIKMAISSLKDTVPEVHDRLEILRQGDSFMMHRWLGQGDGHTRTLSAGMNARGGTNSFLWISEGGPIAANGNQTQWNKIRHGALPSAKLGRIVHETTWMGGKQGGLWELTKPIYEKSPTAEGVLMFFPWHCDPTCVSYLDIPTDSVEEYFKDLEAKLGKKFTKQQKVFYILKKQEQGDEVKREYPSELEEALSHGGEHPKFSNKALDWLATLPARVVSHGEIVVQPNALGAQWVPTDAKSGWLRMWEAPRQGERYLIAADWCTAEYEDVSKSFDYHAIPVIRAAKLVNGSVVPAAVVAAINVDNRAELDIIAGRVASMSRYYGNCVVVPEVNNMHGMVHLLRQAGVTNIWHRTVHVDNPGKASEKGKLVAGWQTSTSTKTLLIDNLVAVLRENQLQLWCPRMLSELRMFQQNLKAFQGHHDDWVMALAIGMFAIGSATLYDNPIGQFGAVPQGVLFDTIIGQQNTGLASIAFGGPGNSV